MYLQLKFSLKLLTQRLGDSLKEPKLVAQYICNIRLCRLHTAKYILDFKLMLLLSLVGFRKNYFLSIFNCTVGLCF